MKRVMIVGQPGGGKSTLARAIGARTGLPVYHMDMIHWMPGWTERAASEKARMAAEVESSDAWVFEGGYTASWDNRLARADMLVVLTTPFLLRIWRVFTRTLRGRGTTRPDLPDNCPERFDAEFWSYIWRTRRTGMRRTLALAERARLMGKPVVVLPSARAVDRFLSRLDTGDI